MTDLAARLAESMRRRRARTQAPITPVLAAPIGEGVNDEPTREDLEVARPAIPSAFTQSAPAERAPIPSGYAAYAPTQPDLASALAMPSAMRPLALDAFLEDDTPFDASLLPPRHIAVPSPRTAQAEFSVTVRPSEFAAAQHDDEAADEDSLTADSADNPYASLLGLAPPRQAFVRINEPEGAAHEAPEPVVIFPGQGPHVAPVIAAAPATGEVNAFRRFDAPASAGQGQPVAANSAAATVDPAEAEQALRTALNNLQRMSGAA